MGNTQLKAALIVTTYNWPEALRLSLDSVLRQSVIPGEVIIADDGSTLETVKTVQEVLGPSQIKWRHVRHEHKGVRQSRIKNLAVRHARGPYLIWVDHDVVLHPHFVHDHISMATKGTFLQGKRSLLPKHYTLELLGSGVFKRPPPWIKGLGNRKNSIRCPFLGKVLSRSRRYETSLRGCNLSLYKEDFIDVDGFDEVFDQSWGREDSDLCYRLFHNGVRVITLWFTALQYHLYHGVTTNWDRERLDAELQRNRERKRVKAIQGFSKLSPEGGIVQASDDF
jgi:glycosyltransferase involved in cell wall biosynthesis